MPTLSSGSSVTLYLSADQYLTLDAAANSEGSLTVSPQTGIGSRWNTQPALRFGPNAVVARQYGPFGTAVSVVLACTAGSVTYVQAGEGFARDASGSIIGLVGLGSDIGSGADLIIGGATQGAGKEIFQVVRVDTNANAVNRPTLAYLEDTAAPAASGTYDFHALDVLGKVSGSNANITANTGLYAIEGKNTVGLTNNQTMGNSVGLFGTSVNFSSAGTTLSNSIGVQAQVQNTGAGTTTVGAALFVKSPVVSAGQITNAYGLFIQAITQGSAQNFAIQTNAGEHNFFASTATPAGGTALVGLTMGSAKVGIYWGSGAPTLSAAQGSIYLRTDGGANSRIYSNSNGSTTWQPITNAA